MEICIGSTNPAKVRQMMAALAPCGIQITAPQLSIILPAVSEDAADAIGNARKKAIAFAAVLDKNCLAMDASLRLPQLPPDQQPGVNVRRLPGVAHRPDDDEVLDYYTGLCRENGGRLQAQWLLGFAIGLPDGESFTESLQVERSLVAPPSKQRRIGYPLDSLQQDPRTGRYLADFTGPAEQALWQEAIGSPLQTFVLRTVKHLHNAMGRPT